MENTEERGNTHFGLKFTFLIQPKASSLFTSSLTNGMSQSALALFFSKLRGRRVWKGNSCPSTRVLTTNSGAFNYDSTANTDDGNCCYISGCTDDTAFNYSSNACYDDGSCIAVVLGCIDVTAFNYNEDANTDDGNCCYIGGCMDSSAFNYDATACYDNGTCIAVVLGCTDLTAFNFDLDKRNQKFKPTDGYRSFYSFDVPLISENNTLTNTISHRYYSQYFDNNVASLSMFLKTANSITGDDVKLSERLNIPSSRLRGFERGKVGPKDGNDFIGGNYVYALNATTTVPQVFQNLQNLDLSLFFETFYLAPHPFQCVFYTHP